MNFTTLISSDDLLHHLENPSWLIMDCRFDLDQPDGGKAAYLQGHIPGAVHVDLEHDLAAPKTNSNGRHPLPSVEALTALFSSHGVGDGTQVVAYDDFGGAFAARLWWSLKYLGHDAVAALDGGFPAWTAKGLPLRDGAENHSPSVFHAKPRPAMVVSAEDVFRSLSDPDLLLLDARSPMRFRGLEETRDPIAGRIPGARNRFWHDNLMSDDRLRPTAELKATFQSILAGAHPENVIAYCGSGVTGCHNLLVMDHIGLSGARLYPGSWSEWITDPARPITDGDPALNDLPYQSKKPE